MPTRNISLTDEFDRFVEGSVSSGDYQNASEVVRDGLRLLQQRQKEEALRLKELRYALREGFAAIDRGDFVALRRDEIGGYVRSLGKRPAKRKQT